MATPKKINSNGRNALESTGPRTHEGKAIASKNAMKHGLLCQEILLPNEDEQAFLALRDNLHEELQPVGELENLLVDRMASDAWRLRRLRKVEAGLFSSYFYAESAERAGEKAGFYVEDTAWQPLSTMTTRITDSGKHEEAVARGRELRYLEEKELSTFGPAFARDATGPDAFSKLSRYETTRERSFYRALHELQRLQATRAGLNVPPPVAVDMEVDFAQSREGPESAEGAKKM